MLSTDPQCNQRGFSGHRLKMKVNPNKLWCYQLQLCTSTNIKCKTRVDGTPLIGLCCTAKPQMASEENVHCSTAVKKFCMVGNDIAI